MMRFGVATALCLAATAPAQVVLRGGELVEAPVEEVSLEGVKVGGESPMVLGWDRVRAVRGERADEAEKFMEIADAAWRARIRLARGDAALARPMFERLFERCEGETGPTALVVAEGLLECRLRRGARVGAVAPWLEALRLRRAGVASKSASSLEGALDEETGLSPALAPIFLGGPAVGAFADAQLGALESDDDVVRALAALYQRAASISAGDGEQARNGEQGGAALRAVRREALEGNDSDSTGRRPAPPEDRATEEHPGVALVSLMVEAQSSESSRRQAARDALIEAIEHEPGGWKEAWRRAAVGLSLLSEENDDAQRRGMVHLLHLPARFAESMPFLSDLARAVVIAELERRGDRQIADSLRSELRRDDLLERARTWLARRRAIKKDETATSTPPEADNKEA